VHWEFIQKVISHRSSVVSKPKVLNLFGYTGIASLAAASAGAEVTHIDASYPTIGWARENQKLSGLESKPIRWILDDCLKFVEREVRRGNKYEGIIMDPPVYGHGPKGEKWDFNISFPQLLNLCIKLLSSQKSFLIINAYAVSASSVMLENILQDFFKEGTIESGELALEESESKRKLSTGIFARWSATR
jgi:23S rRNA (cytosine1962-C5)-methyltransferase